MRLKIGRDDWQDTQILAQVARRAKLGEYTLSVRTRLGSVNAPGTVSLIARE